MRGPKIDPCGTPVFIELYCESVSFHVTHYLRCER